MLLYHMTTADACLKILRSKRLKGSLLEDLNDPFELLAVSTGEKKSRILLKHMKAQLNKKYCLLCFSETWQEPLLWAHYGDKHRGVCLGFDVREGLPQKVTYVSERLDHSFAKETVPFSEKGQRMTRESLHTKHSGWAYEREWRVFTGQEDRNKDGNFYADFGKEISLREVVLGERCKLKVTDIAGLIDKAGPRVTIRAARTAFTTFGIVNNLAVTPRHVGREVSR
jgi:hypothetical protein